MADFSDAWGLGFEKTKDLEDVFFEHFEEGGDVWLSALTFMQCKSHLEPSCFKSPGMGLCHQLIRTASGRYQSINQSINQSIYQSINFSINLPVNQSINPSINLSTYESINRSIGLWIYLSISRYLSVWQDGWK